MILFGPSGIAETFKREFRRIPGATSTHPLPVAVSLVFPPPLNILYPPIMKTLFLGTVFAAFQIEPLRHDAVSTAVNRRVHDEIGRFDVNRIVDAFRLQPESGHLALSLFLSVFGVLPCAIKTVISFSYPIERPFVT